MGVTTRSRSRMGIATDATAESLTATPTKLVETIDLTQDSIVERNTVTFSSSRKRKATHVVVISSDDAEAGNDELLAMPSKKKAKKSVGSKTESLKTAIKSAKKAVTSKISKPKEVKKVKVKEEKRLRPWRDEPPNHYEKVRYRALSQRMYVLDRERTDTDACPEETIQMAGSTGNIYTIRVNRTPKCNCPHATYGNTCKHLIYVMARVLKAPERFQYQRRLLVSEVRSILDAAPATPFASAPPVSSVDASESDGNRKPIEDDCPICVTEMDAGKESIVWCKAACGNNLHADCFAQWAATQGAKYGAVTCPFCRAPWEDESNAAPKSNVELAMQGSRNREGYFNIADRLGLSTQRDSSTYARSWRPQQAVQPGAAEYGDIGQSAQGR